MKIYFTLFLFVLITVNSQAQSLDEILQKHALATGSLKKWNDISTCVIDATLHLNDADIQIKRSVKNGQALRVDMMMPDKSIAYQILTTEEGWSCVPYQGQKQPEPLPDEEIKNTQEQLFLADELLLNENSNSHISFEGSEILNNIDCFKIKLLTKNKKEIFFWIDKKDFQILKKSIKNSVNEIPQITHYFDYRKIREGVSFPYRIISEVGEFTIHSIQINIPLSEKIFSINK